MYHHADFCKPTTAGTGNYDNDRDEDDYEDHDNGEGEDEDNEYEFGEDYTFDPVKICVHTRTGHSRQALLATLLMTEHYI